MHSPRPAHNFKMLHCHIENTVHAFLHILFFESISCFSENTGYRLIFAQMMGPIPRKQQMFVFLSEVIQTGELTTIFKDKKVKMWKC